jgi:hypothetical protein
MCFHFGAKIALNSARGCARARKQAHHDNQPIMSLTGIGAS